MAWTAPSTWADGDTPTGANLNQQLRDNLLALSTHAHGGAAGAGDDVLAGVDTITFDDLAASPNAAGELQRNGANLEWYGAAVVAVTQADAAVGTASPRTLGTGAQQAAAGNHTHALYANRGASQTLAASGGTATLTGTTITATAGQDVGLFFHYGIGDATAGSSGNLDWSFRVNNVEKMTRSISYSNGVLSLDASGLLFEPGAGTYYGSIVMTNNTNAQRVFGEVAPSADIWLSNDGVRFNPQGGNHIVILAV